MTQPLTYPALRSAVLRRVFRRPSQGAELCERSWCISPAEERFERAALFLDGELEKVHDVQEDTTMEAEVRRVTSGLRTHAETRGYQFKDVTLLNGRLIKGAMSRRIAELESDPPGEDVRMASAAVGSTYMGSIYFGHWLRDDATLNIAVQSLAPTIHVARKAYSHEAGYRELLSLDERHVARGHFGELIVLDDWGQNAYKRQRYQELRARARQAIPQRGNELVYLKRGRTSGLRGRDLLNADVVEAVLLREGFVVADPDTMSAGEIAALSMDAKLIVGVEGSHLAHAIYPIAHQGTILVLQPPYRFNNVYKDLADAVGLNYAFVVGDPEQGGFTIDPDRLRRTLDLVPA